VEVGERVEASALHCSSRQRQLPFLDPASLLKQRESVGEHRLIDLDQWSPPASRDPKPATATVLTVAEWTEQCIKARENRSRQPIRPTTADVYRKIARLTVNSSPLGAMPVKDVTRDDMSTWREALPARTRTQNGKAYELLVSVFSDAVREGKIAASPATLRGAGTPERAREPHTMTATEINAYLDAADPKWRVALLLSVTCALRIGETLGLRERDPSTSRRVSSTSTRPWPRWTTV